MSKHPAPVGTLEAVKARGWDPWEYGTCAKYVEGEVLGCSYYKDPNRGGCKFEREKGPKNKGYQLSKSKALGSKVRQGIAPCFVCMQLQAQVEGQSGAFRIIAEEGESLSVPIGKRDALIRLEKFREENKGVEVPKHLMDAAYDVRHPDYGPATQVAVRVTVPAFPSPDDNKEMAQQIYADAVREDELERRKREQVNEALGIKEEKAPVGVEIVDLEEITGARSRKPRG